MSDDDSFCHDYALVGELEVEAAEDRVRVSGTWGEVVFGLWGETVEEAFQNLAAFAERQDDPRPDADADVYRTTDEETWARCLHCDHLPTAEHHDVLGEHVVRCRWDEINDWEVFDRGRAVICPECGGRLERQRLDLPDGLRSVECRDCGESYAHQSYDWGDNEYGKQELRHQEKGVVASVE